MNILLLGSGGREHAFARKLAESPSCKKLFIAPGNAGTALCGENVPVALSDFPAIKKLVLDREIGLVLVGPEEPLVKGLRDFFQQDDFIKHIPFIGPDKVGAQLEGSKDFAKAFMHKYEIPTAAYKTFKREQVAEGMAFLKKLQAPYVLKADGLAAGKGVIIPSTVEDAERELKDMLLNERFGEAGKKVVIEEFLKGIELSVFVLCDGNSYKILPSAKDYKRIRDNDEGPNTGGMGAVSPVPFADASFMKKVEERIVKPSVLGLQKEGIHYCGFLFIGLMNVNGDPYVIEYNVRMGDPETEVVVPRIKSDLVELLMAAAGKKLNDFELQLDERTALTVMLVSGGYPGEYKKGFPIQGLENETEALVFHAGTLVEDGRVLTSGGRVLSVTALAADIESARKKSYERIGSLSFEKMFYRKDIGMDLIKGQ